MRIRECSVSTCHTWTLKLEISPNVGYFNTIFYYPSSLAAKKTQYARLYYSGRFSVIYLSLLKMYTPEAMRHSDMPSTLIFSNYLKPERPDDFHQVFIYYLSTTDDK